jgi:hypothetical protein
LSGGGDADGDGNSNFQEFEDNGGADGDPADFGAAANGEEVVTGPSCFGAGNASNGLNGREGDLALLLLGVLFAGASRFRRIVRQ